MLKNSFSLFWLSLFFGSKHKTSRNGLNRNTAKYMTHLRLSLFNSIHCIFFQLQFLFYQWTKIYKVINYISFNPLHINYQIFRRFQYLAYCRFLIKIIICQSAQTHVSLEQLTVKSPRNKGHYQCFLTYAMSSFNLEFNTSAMLVLFCIRASTRLRYETCQLSSLMSIAQASCSVQMYKLMQ